MRAIKPGALSPIASSSLAITAASVDVALRQMARATQGESVLVVSGSREGVAERFAVVAGNLGLNLLVACAEEHRSGEGLDAEPLDLRSDDFAHRVLEANHGRPVDIVVFCATVNQALHNRIPLAFGGRVVLHGPAAESIDPARFVDSATMYSLHRVSPTALAAANSALYQAALAHLAASRPGQNLGGSELVCSASGLPRQSFSDLRAGWSLTVDMGVMNEVAPHNTGAAAIDPEAAYVITGGFGGFGMAVAAHLIGQGARCVVLIGRSGALGGNAKRQIAAWRAKGVTVREALVDVTSARCGGRVVCRVVG